MWKSTRPLLLVACCLTACATTPAPYPARMDGRLAAYAGSTACCEDPAGFDYTQLPEAGTIDVVIGRSSPAFDFQSGLSRFAAFRLPAGPGAFRVRVKSFFDGPDTPDGSAFYPVLAMMDDSFIVTRVSSLDNLRLEQALATPGGASGFAVTAPFDPSITPERYLVVFTPAVLLGAAPGDRRDGDVLTLPSADWMERKGKALVAPSPFGRISITIAPLAPPGGAG
jgi:maltose operon protein